MSSVSPFAAAMAKIAQEAGSLILRHYESGATPRAKADQSPVTAADEEAEALILERLAALAPGVPIIAEEQMAAGHATMLKRRFFLVDPLDGTKEFLKHNDEFTVNIALIDGHKAIHGVVLAPAKARAFIADGANGAFELAAPRGAGLDVGRAERIRARKAPHDKTVAVVSRSHRDPKTEHYLAAHRVSELLAVGSSLKFCLVASGEADLYPRFGRTMEWDTAAGQAILEAAGGSVKTLDGTSLLYGKAEQGFSNPHFIARGVE